MNALYGKEQDKYCDCLSEVFCFAYMCEEVGNASTANKLIKRYLFLFVKHYFLRNRIVCILAAIVFGQKGLIADIVVGSR